MHLRNATLRRPWRRSRAGSAGGQAQAPGVAAQMVRQHLRKFLDAPPHRERPVQQLGDHARRGRRDQGQGIEFELMFNAQISKQSRSAAACTAASTRTTGRTTAASACRTRVLISPATSPTRAATSTSSCVAPGRASRRLRVDGLATIGNQDWGMFDPWTVGKIRYIDRDNLAASCCRVRV